MTYPQIGSKELKEKIETKKRSMIKNQNNENNHQTETNNNKLYWTQLQ